MRFSCSLLFCILQIVPADADDKSVSRAKAALALAAVEDIKPQPATAAKINWDIGGNDTPYDIAFKKVAAGGFAVLKCKHQYAVGFMLDGIPVMDYIATPEPGEVYKILKSHGVKTECSCGKDCKCPTGFCPDSCPKLEVYDCTSDPVAADAVCKLKPQTFSVAPCPGGICPIPQQVKQ